MEDKYNLNIGVKVFLVSPKNRVLFLKRNADIYKDKEYLLDIPRGRIHEGTSLIDNLEREVFEETGKKLSKDPILLSAQDIWKDKNHIVRITYISRVTEESVILSHEHFSFEWISIVDLMSRIPEIEEFMAEVIKDKMSYIKDILIK